MDQRESTYKIKDAPFLNVPFLYPDIKDWFP